MRNPRLARRRLALAVLAALAVVGLFVGRLVDIQVVRAQELMAQADATRERTVTLWGTRGSIVAEDGTVLADSVDRFDITASPKNYKGPNESTYMTVDGERTKVTNAEAIAAIAAITGDDPAALQQTLDDALAKNASSDFAYLSKAQKLDVFTAVKALRVPWVYDQPHPARSYPDGAVAGNLVGFMGTEGPLAGLELGADACLAATPGKQTYQAAADGTALPGSQIVTEEAKDGGTLRLTIDPDLQWYAAQTLDAQARAVGADWGTAWVVRVSDGHVMAAVDWPAIDPNDLNSVAAADAGARSFSTPYEPGSIMKPATVSSLLDMGAITPEEQWDVPSRYTDGLPAGYAIRDADPHGQIHYTTAGILANSSNIGISMMSAPVDVHKRTAYLEKFGFGSKTAVGFLGESGGQVPNPDTIDPITNVNQQYGQGISATSAQIASLYQTLGNDGVRVPLTLVEGCEHADGTVTDTPSTEGERVVGATAAKQTVRMMESVITNGPLTGAISFPGYRVAAKTGTAQVFENGRYSSARIVSVAGLVPAEDPQYAVIVTLARPDTMTTSRAAAPPFADIVRQVIKTYRIPPSTEPATPYALTW